MSIKTLEILLICGNIKCKRSTIQIFYFRTVDTNWSLLVFSIIKKFLSTIHFFKPMWCVHLDFYQCFPRILESKCSLFHFRTQGTFCFPLSTNYFCTYNNIKAIIEQIYKIFHNQIFQAIGKRFCSNIHKHFKSLTINCTDCNIIANITISQYKSLKWIGSI